MASLHNYRRHQKPMGWLDSIGQKVKNVAEILGAAKGIYDVGKGIYTAGQYIAPVVGALL